MNDGAPHCLLLDLASNVSWYHRLFLFRFHSGPEIDSHSISAQRPMTALDDRSMAMACNWQWQKVNNTPSVLGIFVEVKVLAFGHPDTAFDGKDLINICY